MIDGIEYENRYLRVRSRRGVRWLVGVVACAIVVASVMRIFRTVADPSSTSTPTRISSVLFLWIVTLMYATVAAGSFGRRRWVSAVAAGIALCLFDGMARQVGTALAELSLRPSWASKWDLLTRGFFVQTWMGAILLSNVLPIPFAAALATGRARRELEASTPDTPDGVLARLERLGLGWLPLDRQGSFATSVASAAAVLEGLFYLSSVPAMALRHVVPPSTPGTVVPTDTTTSGSIWTLVALVLGVAWIAAGVHAARSDDRPTRTSAMRYLVALSCTSVLWSVRTHWELLTGLAKGQIGYASLTRTPVRVGQIDGIVAEVMMVIVFALLARRAGACDAAADAIGPITPHTR